MAVKIARYCSPNPGPHLAVLGAVHGNEVCGPLAIEEVLAQIESGDIPVLQGSVTFVPVANPLAYERNVRYIDHNLNFNLHRCKNPVDYEDVIGNILCPILEECDVLLDIHSYGARGPAFTFVGSPNEKEDDLRRSLGFDVELSGWSEAQRKHINDPNAAPPIGAVGYARKFGATAVKIECGQHEDPRAVDVAIKAIRNTLDYCRISPANGFKTKPQELRLRVKIESVYKRDEGGELAKDWSHTDYINKGEVLAYRCDGSKIIAPTDGFVLLPHNSCPVGEDWFYFGINEKLAS